MFTLQLFFIDGTIATIKNHIQNIPLAIADCKYDTSSDEIMDRYILAKLEELKEDAFKYAATRVALYNSGKVVENYVSYEENMYYFTEWLKQLYGESEGKEGVGIFPVSTVHTRDLHSLGQFIQEGNKILFETFIVVRNNNDLKIGSYDMNDVNNFWTFGLGLNFSSD